MKRISSYIVGSLTAGLLILVPLYLAVLLLLKAMASLAGLVRPFIGLLPDWLPAERILSLGLVLVLCFVVGAVVRARAARGVRERFETSFLDRIPGYAVIRSLTLQMVGQGDENAWKPAFVEIEEALVPGFIIERHEDGRFTVFVPSVPTPFAGAVYVLSRERIHPLDVPFTQAIRPVSRWGAGCKELVAAMKT